MELVEPTTALHEQWLAAHREWGPGLHEDGFGLTSADEVETPAGFAAWVARARAEGGYSWWVVEDGRVVGGIGLRDTDEAQVEPPGTSATASSPPPAGAAWRRGPCARSCRSPPLAAPGRG